MKNRVLFAFLFTFCCLYPVSAFANSDGKTPDKKELEAALQSCAESVSQDSNGHPDRKEMDECMKDKGFSPPPHGEHHGGEHGDPPPPKPENSTD